MPASSMRRATKPGSASGPSRPSAAAAARRAGLVRRTTCHSLRHSFAVNTLKRIKLRGESPQQALPVLAAYLGHSEYKHTAKYLKLLDAELRFARDDDERADLHLEKGQLVESPEEVAAI